MEKAKLTKCPHCGSEGQFSSTAGKLLITSFPPGEDLRKNVQVVTCLNCSHVELFSPDLAERVQGL